MMEKSDNDVSEIEEFDANAQWHAEEYATYTWDKHVWCTENMISMS